MHNGSHYLKSFFGFWSLARHITFQNKLKNICCYTITKIWIRISEQPRVGVVPNVHKKGLLGFKFAALFAISTESIPVPKLWICWLKNLDDHLVIKTLVKDEI